MLAVGSVIVLAMIGMLIFSRPDPPVVSLEETKSAIDRAAQAGALRYARETYQTAQTLLKEGWLEMSRQDGRLAPFRTYRLADSLLSLACKTAQEAVAESKVHREYLDSLSRGERDELEYEIGAWREALNGSLTKLKAQAYLSSADLSLETGRLFIDQGEYQDALSSLAKGREFLGRLSDMLARYSNDEAQKLDLWRSWVQETLAESQKKGAYAVIVDKSAHKTYLVRTGKLMHTYDCDLGYNSAHNKFFSGDGATPEGKYKVVSVKSRGSKYYKALLLDYPNQSDKRRFQQNKEKGIISPYAHIGGLIEIHGDGGKGQDWTEGCVALSNADMDHLMRHVSKGTPVTIVRRSDRWP
jgi:hypothetical protein